jgi:DNA mismatch repair protein MutS
MANAYTEYFANQLKYTQSHGRLTIFFTQCGMFFESYENLTEGYDLQILSSILNISVTKKDKSLPVSNKNPYMLGFPCAVLNKYIKMLIDSGYTVVIEEQVTPAPKPKRAITGIYSPSTYINEISKPDSNYMLTILLEEIDIYKSQKKGWGVGLCLAEPSTGYIKIHECYSTSNDIKISLDEIIKFINLFAPSEVLIITSGIESPDETIGYLELKTRSYLHKTIQELKALKGYSNCQSLGYQSDLLKRIYKINTNPFDSLQIDRLTYGKDAFVITLMYLYEHNSNLLNSISKPEIYVKEDSMHLGNNPITQLDIFVKEDSSYYSSETTYRSLFDIVNRTSTPMGRRHLKSKISEPMVDPVKLNLSYQIIEHLKSQLFEGLDIYTPVLSEIKDIERLSRKISVKNIHPIDFSQWIKYIGFGLDLINLIRSDKLLGKLFDDYTSIELKENKTQITKLIEYIGTTFQIPELEKYLINDITGSIFVNGKYPEIDNLQESINICNHFMDGLADSFNNIIKSKVSNKVSAQTDPMVKVDSNERDGYFLVLTTKRAEILKTELKKYKTLDVKIGSKVIQIHTTSIRFVEKGKGASTKIFCDELKEKSDSINDLIDEIKTVLKDGFVQELETINTQWIGSIESLCKLIGQFDFLLSGAKCANKFFYNKPVINDKYEFKSYFKASDLRHPIVEQINTDTEYIPVSVELGTETQDGMLLFGVNAAGKSTLQKAIGISVIMAQIGYFVPATKFVYYPYKSIITRIKSSDNIFKGLSTFGLELVELEAILKRNSSNCLVIADELCSGTEHVSSLVIVMTMITMLSEANASFITATHLHDLNKFSRLELLTNVQKYHLHVEKDPKTGKLKYDRNLRPGSGDNFYGLVVAQHMISDSKFSSLSNEFLAEYNGMELSSDKKSRYNSKVFVQSCAVCGLVPKPGQIPLETHHINPQVDTDSQGRIRSKPHIHKNHKSNLVVLCSACHDMIDSKMIEISGWYDTNEGRELDLIIGSSNKIKSIKDLDLINKNLSKKIKNTLNSINL